MRNRLRVIILAGAGCLALAAAISVAAEFPPNSAAWLSRPGTSDNTEAAEYYAAIGAPLTLGQWKTAYGFSGANDTLAIYYNGGDLGFGREMHCRKNGSDVACYVVNHGLGAGGPVQASIADAINNQNNLPTVAMVYQAALEAGPNDVSFYVYDPAGNLVNGVALDSEGDKFVPNMCLACHGGYYDSTGNAAYSANFLPFDTESFRYSLQAGYSLADQQEDFRQLNALVRDTNPSFSITELIDGWYAATGGVSTPGSTADPNFVPPGHAGDPDLYAEVFKPNCRSCHIAQVGYTFSTTAQLLAWNGSSNFNTGYAVFHTFDMPHAELTSRNFWNSPAPAALANSGGWSYRVTRLDDPAPDGCNPGDCSLREAILAANSGLAAPVYKSIITFDVDGTFTLTRPGSDDAGAVGDLDILLDVILLGNGPDRTIIDGGGIDRVFHILGGVGAVIQNVTIQNGQVASAGGGIYNDGSRLTLNNSVVKDNTASGGSTLYTSSDVPKSIASSGTPVVTSELTLAGGVIVDLNVVGLNGTHTFVNDLSFTLQSPAGTLVEIMARSCGGEDNFNISLDDEAAPGAWPCPPNDGGVYQPSNSLSVFDGEDSTGTWILTVFDNANLDGGSLNGWGLEILTGAGAGIANANGAITGINYSTLGPGNAAADQGGGMFSQDSTVTLEASTIGGNSAASGAGLANAGFTSATINASTIVGNAAAGSGGGLANIDTASVSVRNTIVAGNTGASSADCANAATYTSQGYNLVGQNGSANGCPTDGTTVVLAGPIHTALNPNLAGAPGRAPYFATVRSGPAVDAIPLGANCTLPSYDQLDLPRPQDGNGDSAPACDIGAREAPADARVYLPLIVR